jgi:hypothetical protein
MSDKETDVENLAIDPPDNQGGGNLAETSSTETAGWRKLKTTTRLIHRLRRNQRDLWIKTPSGPTTFSRPLSDPACCHRSRN